MQNFQIAIDGPAGAGKSTIAKKIAQALNIDYIDTGAMYRAVAYKMLNEGIEINNSDGLKSMLERTQIDFKEGNIILDGKVISDGIRTDEITKIASKVSALPEVREKLVKLQQDMGIEKNIVLDGRDIGTNVFPGAKYKYYLTASVKERARRRWIELTEKGHEIDLQRVENDIAARDYSDSARALNPLRKAQDAVEIDTTDMDINQVVQHILDHIKSR